MEASLTHAPAKPASNGNGTGGITLEGTSLAMTPGSDTFRKMLEDVDSEACCAVARVCGEAERVAGLFKETGEAEILCIMSAAAGISPADSGGVSVQQSTARAIGTLTGDEAHDKGTVDLPTAEEVRAVPEASERAEETNGQPTGDPSGELSFVRVAVLPPLFTGAAAPAAPTDHIVPRQTATGDARPGVIESAPARPIAPCLNGAAEDPPPPQLRAEPASQTSQSVAQWAVRSRDRMDQPGADKRLKPAEPSGPARGQVDLNPQAESGRVMDLDELVASGPEGRNRSVSAAGCENGHVAENAAGDSANCTGEGRTSDQPTANEQKGEEFVGLPKSQAVVRLHERDHRFSIESVPPHMPTVSGSAPGFQPPDHPFDPAPIRPDMLPRPTAGFGESGAAKTVHAVQMNLDPDDLGWVRVRVVLADSTVHTHVTTESADLGQFLIGRRDQLESAFHASGLDMGQFKVHIDQQGSGQSANDWAARSFGDQPQHPHGRHKPMVPDQSQPYAAEPHGLSVFA
ncbi:MAG TPA: flagellar hook-length control protein FliK [Nitrospiraceae bacterium]|jgi:hypothetical protein|nr:flagellar hook-length control protein FliK [Nitrospiraceae bacterium]